MAEPLVAGVDCSTQSTKVLLCRAGDGAVVGHGSAPHPPGTECPPAAWWDALHAAGEGLLERAAAVGVAGQQHGMVVLDDRGEVIRPALLWNDTRSADAAAELVDEFGGPDWWARRTGSVPTFSFTVTKLRWLARHEKQNADRAASVLLPHDWLTWRLTAGSGAADGFRTPVTDRGDASGTGYFATPDGTWLPEVAEAALGRSVSLPRVAAPAQTVGETSWGAVLSAGTGDNMAAALGLGLGLGLGAAAGDVAVSIGTSGTAFAVSSRSCADASGAVAGFADATGLFLPLVCTTNAAVVLDTVGGLLGTDPHGLSSLALRAGPGAGGLTLLPYLDGERTPSRPGATGVLRGLTTRNATPQNIARAAIEAVLASLASAVELLEAQGVRRRRVLLIGGAARGAAVRELAPAVFGVPVAVPAQAEYVALGAARQAAWALCGSPEPPDWPPPAVTEYQAEPRPEVLARHVALRADTADWA